MRKTTFTWMASAIFILSLALPGQLRAQVIKPARIDKSIRHGVSPPVRDIKSFTKEDPIMKAEVHQPMKPKQPLPNDDPGYRPEYRNVQDLFYSSRSSNSPAVELDFEGIGRADIATKYYPPDTHGDAGPNHYVQAVNAEFKIFDKAGNTLVGNLPIKSLFEAGGFDDGQPFEGKDPIDPVVLYDEYADRWFIGGFTIQRPYYYMLIAVSTSPDPTGTYNLYAFEYMNVMPDYEKFGVWHDGYYMTTNNFPDFGGSYAEMRVFDRDAMLSGDATVESVIFNLGSNYFGFLPADADGFTPPPDTMAHPSLALSGTELNTLDIMLTRMDWDNPANATVSFNTLSTDPFSNGGYAYQPGNYRLDGLAARLMYRLQYRNFGTHHTLVANHTVRNTTNGVLGIRWYELRTTGSGFGIHQQGTLLPDDGTHRWMGSIAMNGNGDIALGYSVTNPVDVYPSIRFTGQTAGAPEGLGVMDKPETEIVAGTTAYTGGGFRYRWGDYSAMTVDPTDDYTFWYTQEYSTDASMWVTRVAKLDLETPFCGVPEELSASGFTSSTADLAWSEAGTSTAWEVIVVPAGADPSVETPVGTSATPYTATGLAANTGYDFYVRADCGDGSYSDWAGPASFLTDLPDCAAWDFVGSADFSNDTVLRTNLAIDDNGTPYVCINETNLRVSVMTFDGTSWVYVGGEGFASAGRAVMAIYNNIPHVVFEDPGNGNKLSAMRYADGNWENVGNAGFTPGQGLYPVAAFNDDILHVAFIDRNSGDKVSVMRYNNSAWEYVGSPGFTNYTNTGIDLATDNGMPYVAYQDVANGQKAAVYKFNGSWVLLGNGYATEADANSLALAVQDGIAHLAFRQFLDATFKLSVRTFDGAWANTGATGFAQMNVAVDIATKYGVPYVLYGDQANGVKATVQRYNGTAWEVVGASGFSAGPLATASIAFFNGVPFVSYSDFSSSWKVNVQKFGCCTTPSDLTADNIAENSAELNWTENGTSLAWQVKLGLTGFDPAQVNAVPVSSRPYAATSLNSGTDYDYYVRSDCGDGSFSAWSGPYSFQTLFSTPVAQCQNVSIAAGEDCQAEVTADQVDNGSYDPGGNPISLSLSPAGPYQLGDTDVTLTVSNGVYESTCDATITVTDDTPPEITGVDTLLLWPPNHKYESIAVTQLVTGIVDGCDPGVGIGNIVITSVTSDEEENAAGEGDGNTVDDILIAADCQSVQVRRERDEFANGRVYTVCMEVEDADGNLGTLVSQLHVPIASDMVSVDDGMSYGVNGNCNVKSAFADQPADPFSETYELFNYPNPFSGTTTISFAVGKSSYTKLNVYDAMGKEVATLYEGIVESGLRYSFEFNAQDLPKGMYFYRLQSGDKIHQVRKMLLMK